MAFALRALVTAVETVFDAVAVLMLRYANSILTRKLVLFATGVARFFVIASDAIPYLVATMTHVDARTVQTTKLFRPATRKKPKVVKND